MRKEARIVEESDTEEAEMIFRKHQGSGASSDSSLIDLGWVGFSPPDDSCI